MKKTLLVILDGWGMGENYDGNAILQASTPTVDSLLEKYPHSQLIASGEDVGLPVGQMGNSEVGHLNIGAGRVIYQDLTRINKEIESGNFCKNKPILDLIQKTRDSGKNLHLIGLVSKGGVHSHINHLYALLEMCKGENMDRVYIHVILDGRDVDPKSGFEDLQELETKIQSIGVGQIITVVGRYYAMDRDRRWDRTKMAYDAMVYGEGKREIRALEAVSKSYAKGVTDEFVLPVVIADKNVEPVKIEDGDGVLFFNFRPDRGRQLTRALTEKDFSDFNEDKPRPCVDMVTMTEYEEALKNLTIAYPPEVYTNTLGQYLSDQGLSQLRVAETEKYAHVTFFFNGGVEKPNPREERVLIPSPKVATYDLQPAMSAEEVMKATVQALEKGTYDFVVVNFANPDMVGHTGKVSAAIEAIEAVDKNLKYVVDAAEKAGYTILITADHGNCELMTVEGTKEPVTSHTTNPVFLIGVDLEDGEGLADGRLCDLAPTIVDVMGLEKPVEMTGKSLIEKGK